MQELTGRSGLLVGFALLACIGSLLIAGCLAMVLGGRITRWSAVCALLGTALATLWAGRQLLAGSDRRLYLRIVLLVGLVLVAAAYINALLYDSSWDGQGYQSEGVMAVARGWDIYAETAPSGAHFAAWLAYFSKGP